MSRLHPAPDDDWFDAAQAAIRAHDDALVSEHPSYDRISAGRRTGPENTVMHDSDRFGFRNLGEFARAVQIASNPEPGPAAAKMAERLRNAALTEYGSEGVGADGGFAVPPDFREQILSKITEQDTLLSRVDVVPTSSSSVTVPKDERAPWQTSTGIKAYWEGEANVIPQSRPVLETSTIKLNKLQALVPVTDELLEDAPALAGHLLSKGTQAINWKVDDAFVNGSGAGMPLGILNSTHQVEVAKETSQVAGTIHGLNLIKMWSRMPAAWRKSAVWLAHPDCEREIMQAGLQVTNPAQNLSVGGSLAYIAPGGIADSPYASLFGRPVILTQACQTPGTKGDLIFWSPNQYAVFARGDGLRFDSSIHLWFDQGVTAFRFTLRIGGQPWWSTPIADKNGGNTRSSIVTLATRS